MQEIFRKILADAVFAPSGDNQQPWTFRLGENYVDIYDSSTPSLYDFKQHATYISHGALIENIVRLAAVEGYASKVKVFPDIKDYKHISRIEFTDAPKTDPESIRSIKKRFTDRMPFLKHRIDARANQAIQEAGQRPPFVRFEMIQSRSLVKKLVDLLAVGDKMILDNQELHKYFYDNIRWTDDEFKRTQDGMHIRSITRNPMMKFLLRILKSWKITKFFRLFGLEYTSYLMRRHIYEKSPALGYFVIHNNWAESYVETGRALQSVWLAATDYDISLQPMSSMLFLYSRLRGNSPESITNWEASIINRVTGNVYKLLGVKDEVITFFVRLGYAKTEIRPPSVRKSPKFIE